ncbi:triphosphoribosyl-dephospho-CoA synthase [Streptomyces sp. NPDC101165]|uniref:triphosphoribosyl-dephospho-CoA synthase n=1 Tax=Streptomyces sp. NPDC101165 TaxID=3366119 RepID=UPI0037F48388
MNTREDEALARAAVAALTGQLALTPKPGLPDPRDLNARTVHADHRTLRWSAMALTPGLAAMAAAARRTAEPTPALRAELGAIGRCTEHTVTLAGGGHRGALWVLGLLVAAVAVESGRGGDGRGTGVGGSAPGAGGRASGAGGSVPGGPGRGAGGAARASGVARRSGTAGVSGAVGASGTVREPGRAARDPRAHAHRITALARQIAAHSDRGAPARPTRGSAVSVTFGAAGARGEARAGFPHVRRAWDALGVARAGGADEARARLDALLTVMSTLQDTELLHTAGPIGLRQVQAGARAVLEAGGTATAAGAEALAALDADLHARAWSPRGSAGLLAGALFLDALPVSPRGPAR